MPRPVSPPLLAAHVIANESTFFLKIFSTEMRGGLLSNESLGGRKVMFLFLNQRTAFSLP